MDGHNELHDDQDDANSLTGEFFYTVFQNLPFKSAEISCLLAKVDYNLL